MFDPKRHDPEVYAEVSREVDNLLVQFEIWKRKETKRLKAEGKAEGKAMVA